MAIHNKKGFKLNDSKKFETEAIFEKNSPEKLAAEEMNYMYQKYVEESSIKYIENNLKNMEIDEKKSSFSKKKDIEDGYNKYFSIKKKGNS